MYNVFVQICTDIDETIIYERAKLKRFREFKVTAPSSVRNAIVQPVHSRWAEQMGLLRSSFICGCGHQMTCEPHADYCDDVVFRCNICWRKKSARIKFFHLIQIMIKANMTAVESWTIKASATLTAARYIDLVMSIVSLSTNRILLTKQPEFTKTILKICSRN